MLHVLAALTVVLSAADHWTTYLCLRDPIAGWHVSEANPLSDWLFQRLGLVPGLLLDSALTVAAVAFLVTTPRLPHRLKQACFGVICLWTAYAVINNFGAIAALGLSPLGRS